MGFFREFFSNLREGLLKERVQNSSSECSSVIAAFMECLRFCLLHEFGGKGADSTVQEYLIKEQVGKFLQSSLPILLFSHVFSLHLHDRRPVSSVGRAPVC